METIHKKLLRKTFPCQYSNPWSYHIRNLTTPPPCNSTVNCWMTSFFSNDLHIKLIASNYGFILLFFSAGNYLYCTPVFCLKWLYSAPRLLSNSLHVPLYAIELPFAHSYTNGLTEPLPLPYTTNSCMEQLWDRIFLLSQKLWL